MLGLESVNRLAQKFLTASAIHIGKGHDGETGILHQPHLCQLGLPFQMVTDQVESENSRSRFLDSFASSFLVLPAAKFRG